MALTVEVERYRWVEAIANAGFGVLRALGARATALDTASICADARRLERAEDWGDERFLVHLDRLVHLLDEAGITPLARALSRGILLKAVRNRLRLRRYVAAHPEVAEVPIDKPMFVVGFPRTGTTALQNLLALGDHRRALAFWELQSPAPLHPDPAVDAARRIRQADRMLRIAYTVAPEMGAIHEIRATTAEEDWSLFATTMAVYNYELQSGLTAWGDALMAEGIAWAYSEFREMLQVLLHQRPARQLVLKCPEHLWFLDDLLHVFPDAAVLWTHREPFDAVGSYCSLISMNRRFYYGAFRPAELGPFVTDRFALGVERALAVRRARPDRVADVHFHDLVRDHVGVVRSLCARFDAPVPVDLDALVAAWHASGRADKRGSHHYDTARYGLDRAEVHARFSPYIDEVQIRVEG